MTRIRISLWNSLKGVILYILKISTKFGVAPQSFCWKSKFCLRSGFGSGSWFYFGFQYQTYISYIEDTHHILFGSANSFESYCVHMKSPRTYVHPDIQPDRQTDRQTDGNFFLLLLSFNIYKTWTFIKRFRSSSSEVNGSLFVFGELRTNKFKLQTTTNHLEDRARKWMGPCSFSRNYKL